MATLVNALVAACGCVGAVLRIHTSRQAQVKKGKAKPAVFRVNLAGTAWCVVDNRFLVTAYHLFNGGKPRDPSDKFYVFVVPQNGPQAFHFPVIDFPFEDSTLDLAIIEIGPPVTPGIHITASPVTFARQPDGARVFTLGFPAPEITAAKVDPQGNWRGGNFFLKTHANEGIVSAQYDLDGVVFYELNVTWHHGESGGPIFRLDDPVAAFATMQQYRNVQSPHGTVAGPHRGRSLSAIEQTLCRLGARVV